MERKEGRNENVTNYIFQSNRSCCIAGPSFSGKSTFCIRLIYLREKLFPPGDVPKKILYCYGVENEIFKKLKEDIDDISFHKGLPSLEKIKEYADDESLLLIIDDLIQDVVDSKDIELLLIREAHHSRISTFVISQNLYARGKNSRSISINYAYVVLTNSPRDKTYIATLSRQFMPGRPKMLLEAYLDAIKLPFSYLFADFTVQQDENLRLQTNIFPGETRLFYVPK